MSLLLIVHSLSLFLSSFHRLNFFSSTFLFYFLYDSILHLSSYSSVEASAGRAAGAALHGVDDEDSGGHMDALISGIMFTVYIQMHFRPRIFSLFSLLSFPLTISFVFVILLLTLTITREHSIQLIDNMIKSFYSIF